ncbi:pentapeptide repeat-containing protein [Amycolatopsis nigrescens]|uniref:pentapeptide repeat-containing protein n=1 Tax=Amycolatopsis nigrescens TaxID=381445 RepID=UPI00037DF43D
MIRVTWRGRDSEAHQVLAPTTILLWSIGLLVLAALSVTLLWVALGNGGSHDSVRLDVIRTASSIVIGTGGAAALLLAARRQRVTELDVKQKDHDATERRVTELYGKAADQLGSDKAPVRLAGLYALERLAQGNPAHRQTIVELICAYLRMPFRPPTAPASTPPKMTARSRDTSRSEEWEVRQAAQALLTKHLRDPDEPTFWPGIELNLSGATLDKFMLTHCAVRSAQFTGTTFVGPALFRGTTIERTADFRDVRFTGLADFRRVSFGENGKFFRGARFEGEVDFGTQTEVCLSGALTRADRELRRKWPEGWQERERVGERAWAEVIVGP